MAREGGGGEEGGLDFVSAFLREMQLRQGKDGYKFVCNILVKKMLPTAGVSICLGICCWLVCFSLSYANFCEARAKADWCRGSGLGWAKAVSYARFLLIFQLSTFLWDFSAFHMFNLNQLKRDFYHFNFDNFFSDFKFLFVKKDFSKNL